MLVQARRAEGGRREMVVGEMGGGKKVKGRGKEREALSLRRKGRNLLEGNSKDERERKKEEMNLLS